MPVYKNEKNNTYYVRFKEKDIRGKVHEVSKYGFDSKKAAKKWEESYKTVKSGSIRMTLEQFVTELYLPEIKPRLRPSSWETKTNMIYKHILPILGHHRINEIEARTVILWQNEIMQTKNPRTGKPYAKSYLQSINEQLIAIMSYAVKYYNLPVNVAHTVGNMGSEDDIHVVCWTLEQYKQFMEVMMDKPLYYYAFLTLFMTGIRVGELGALTFRDIDFEKRTMTINKTYSRVRGQDIIGPPKTKQSYRTIVLNEKLVEALKEYKSMIYKPDEDDRVFNISKSSLNREMKRGARVAGIPETHVHSARHFMASTMLDMGYSVLDVASRLGHAACNVQTTYKYLHENAGKQAKFAEDLDRITEEDAKDVTEEKG